MHIPLTPPSVRELRGSVSPDRLFEVLVASIQSVPGDDGYLHWDKLLHLTPPSGLTAGEWWLRLKVARGEGRRSVPLRDRDGGLFSFMLPDSAQELLHRVDQEASGRIAIADTVTNPATRDRYVLTSLIEEAITSSQLEGASTSRKVAKEMLQSGREPQTHSERMISNNFRAMQFVVEHQQRDMSPDFLFEIHRIVTAGTLDDDGAAGRLQVPGEVRVRLFGDGDQVLHNPPPAEELPERLRLMCDFANGSAETGWVHPVVRSIILHFWMGYDHYFEDGNGRTARAVFYWSMLRQGYWLSEFLTISTILRKGATAYAQSFLLTESDDNDLTYFILHQLRVLDRALTDLEKYLQRKLTEVAEVESLLRAGTGLNHRQRALLGEALRDPHAVYNIDGHRRLHQVTYQTARTDLLDLAERELLIQDRVGRAFIFIPPVDLGDRLRALGPASR